MGYTDICPDVECGVEPSGDIIEFIPHYTTDIREAWKVVEKLSRGSNRYVEIRQGKEMDGCQVAIYEHYRPHDLLAVAFADTTSEAICLAALKAVGVEQ
jgi:hypothetical protein